MTDIKPHISKSPELARVHLDFMEQLRAGDPRRIASSYRSVHVADGVAMLVEPFSSDPYVFMPPETTIVFAGARGSNPDRMHERVAAASFFRERVEIASREGALVDVTTFASDDQRAASVIAKATAPLPTRLSKDYAPSRGGRVLVIHNNAGGASSTCTVSTVGADGSFTVTGVTDDSFNLTLPSGEGTADFGLMLLERSTVTASASQASALVRRMKR
jgi:hypothetical protein